MNKIIKGLLVAALATSASYIQAHTNKTTLVPRSHGVNLALENTAGWYELMHRKADDKFGGNFQAAFFYADSTNKADLGKFFAIRDNNNVATKYGNNLTAADNDLGFIIHNRALANANTAAANDASFTFEPEQKAIGVYLNYHQDLDKILNGLYLRVNLPVVNVENDMHVTTAGAEAANLTNFFNGTYNVAVGAAAPANAAQNAQAALTNALIAGKDSQTGIADIDVILGYSFLNKESYHASLNLGVTIPTGNTPDGKRVFQAIYGNGQHVAFGGGLDFGARVWGDNDHNVKLHAGVNYRYLFESREKRTLGIKGSNLGQYVGLLDTTAATLDVTQLIPAANILTQNVNVTPGSQLDAIVALGYNNGCFALDFGYNLFYREADSVTRKDAFVDGRYGIALTTLNMAANTQIAGNAGNIAASILGTALTSANLDTEAAANGAQTTHKVYGGVAYITRSWETPIMLGAGGHYEFASQNSAVGGWGVNAKAGVSF